MIVDSPIKYELFIRIIEIKDKKKFLASIK